jgi:hypothetical protein
VERGRILDEFVAVTGLHRKHAMRLLRGGQPSRHSSLRPGRPTPWEAELRRGGARGADRGLGGLGPGLRQAAATTDAGSGRGDGAAWSPATRARGPHAPDGDECRHDRPVIGRGQEASGEQNASAHAAIGRDPA